MSAVPEQLVQLEAEYQRSRAFLKGLEDSIKEHDDASAGIALQSQSEKVTCRAAFPRLSSLTHKIDGSKKRTHSVTTAQPEPLEEYEPEPAGTHALCRPSIINLDADTLSAAAATHGSFAADTSMPGRAVSFTAQGSHIPTPVPSAISADTNVQSLYPDCCCATQRTLAAPSPTTAQAPSARRSSCGQSPPATSSSGSLLRLVPPRAASSSGSPGPGPAPPRPPIPRSGAMLLHARSFRYRTAEAFHARQGAASMGGDAGDVSAGRPLGALPPRSGGASAEPVAAGSTPPSLAACGAAAPWAGPRASGAQTADGSPMARPDGEAAAAPVAAVLAAGAAHARQGQGRLPAIAPPALRRVGSRCGSPMGADAADSGPGTTSSGALRHSSSVRGLPVKGSGSLKHMEYGAAALDPDGAIGTAICAAAASAAGCAAGSGVAGPESRTCRRLLPVVSSRYLDRAFKCADARMS